MEQKFKLNLVLFMLLAIAGCIREEDVNDPVIEYIEPGELAVFNLPDTIDIKVRITDDNRLSMVTLNLLNEDKIPCVTPQYFYPSGDELSINTALALYDKTMPSGTYSLQVFASDGENTKFKYRDIVIREVPTEILGYMAVTAPLSFTSSLIRLTPDFETDSQLGIPETHRLSGVSGLWGQFFFVTDEPSIITAYDPFTFEQAWEVGASPPKPVFTDIFVDNELVFGTENGDVGIISVYGNINLRTGADENYRVKHIAADQNYIYAAHQSLNGDINRLSVYYRITGSLVDQRQLSVEIAALVPVDGFLMVFTQHGNGFDIKRYYPENFLLVNFCSRDGDSLISVEKITDDHMMLVTNRCIIEYDYPCSFNDFTAGPYDFCRIDTLNNVVFLAKDKTVTGFNLATGNLVEEIPFNDKVVDFQILYNK